MKLAFIGPQASGKGTQAILLSKKLNLPHISTGDIFRQTIRDDGEIGKKLKVYLDKGNLVSDDLTNKIVRKRLAEKDTQKGYILDGYPRTLKQAYFLDKIDKLDKVIEIHISDKEALIRISNRRSCACGATYNLLYNPPKKEGICDRCGGKLFIRDDDKPVAVKKRLKLYHQKTKPLIDYYCQKGILLSVDGERPIKEIEEDIIKKLKINLPICKLKIDC